MAGAGKHVPIMQLVVYKIWLHQSLQGKYLRPERVEVILSMSGKLHHYISKS
jgi:hypothetical protein